MVALLPGPIIVRAGRGGQRVQHRAEDRRAFGGQNSGTLEGRFEPDAAILEVLLWVLIGEVAPGPLIHLRRTARPVLQPQTRRPPL